MADSLEQQDFANFFETFSLLRIDGTNQRDK